MHRIFWQRENQEGNQKSDYQWRGQYRDCMEYRWPIFQVRWMLMELGVPRKYGTPFFSRYKYCFKYTAIVGIMESELKVITERKDAIENHEKIYAKYYSKARKQREKVKLHSDEYRY